MVTAAESAAVKYENALVTVTDLDKALATLSSRGVKFSPVKDDKFIRTAHFADSDGNPLYLCEVKKWG